MLEAVFLNPIAILLAKIFLIVGICGYLFCTILDKKLQKAQRRAIRRLHHQRASKCA